MYAASRLPLTSFWSVSFWGHSVHFSQNWYDWYDLLNVFSCPILASKSWPFVLCNPGREIPSTEIYPDTTTTIQRGASALFQCHVTGGTPSPTVEWTRYCSLTLNTLEMIEQIMLQYIYYMYCYPQTVYYYLVIPVVCVV